MNAVQGSHLSGKSVLLRSAAEWARDQLGPGDGDIGQYARGTRIHCRSAIRQPDLNWCVRPLCSKLYGCASSVVLVRGVQKKLGSIVNCIRRGPSLLPPLADRVYRNSTNCAISEIVSILRSPKTIEAARYSYAFRT